MITLYLVNSIRPINTADQGSLRRLTSRSCKSSRAKLGKLNPLSFRVRMNRTYLESVPHSLSRFRVILLTKLSESTFSAA